MHDIFRREGPAASLPLVRETILPGLLIDDCITPDTSRFWSLESYKPDRSLPVLSHAGLLSRLRGRGDR